MSKRVSGEKLGGLSRGPFFILSFLFGMLAFMGYLYHQNYRGYETHIIYLVYFMGFLSILFFFIGTLKARVEKSDYLYTRNYIKSLRSVSKEKYTAPSVSDSADAHGIEKTIDAPPVSLSAVSNISNRFWAFTFITGLIVGGIVSVAALSLLGLYKKKDDSYRDMMAIISQNKKEISSLESERDDLRNKIDTLEKKFGLILLTSQYEKADEKRINALKSELDDLKKKIGALEKKAKKETKPMERERHTY